MTASGGYCGNGPWLSRSRTCGPEPKSYFPQLCAGTFASALPIPSSAATATATVLFRKSLRCIAMISLLIGLDCAHAVAHSPAGQARNMKKDCARSVQRESTGGLSKSVGRATEQPACGPAALMACTNGPRTLFVRRQMQRIKKTLDTAL